MPPEPVLVPEPGNFFEAQEAQEKIAKFSGRGPAADAGGAVQSAGVNDKPQEMQMLVAVRMRPLWQKEDDAGDHRCVSVLQGKVVNVTDPWYDEVLNPNRQKEKRYAFDIVFDDDVGQLEVFEKTSKGLVSGVLDGYNASVFAYGATGAGKTHTMLGSLEEPGIMVNTLHEIYGAMEADFQDSKFKVTLSYVEIYNEMIKDLLSPEGVDLKLNEDPVRGMVVQGVTEFGASTADEILELLHRGNLHRTVEPTAANQVSSRSHAVLQVTIEQSERTAHVTGNVRIGKLSMVDLAGSERASKTDNKGARLKEGANINRSLLALGNCITALADKKRVGHVPYRDSKMTRLLKDSLGGNCRTVMIASISPSHRQFEETVNTLKYANRAKNLKTQVARNVMSVSAHIAEYQRIIMELRNQVSGLKNQLQDRPTAIQEESSGRLGTSLKEMTPSGNRSKQRTLDYVENLEKQHLQNAKNALLQAGAERHALLQRLTDITTQATALSASNTWGVLGPLTLTHWGCSLSRTGVAASHTLGSQPPALTWGCSLSAHRRLLDTVQVTDLSAAITESGVEVDAAALPPVASSALHDQLATVRRQLQQNQQTVQEIMQTAVQRISSGERLQLLQLMVRGQFLELLNEQQESELGMRRELTQAAMGQGALPPILMKSAFAAESWHTEHRPAMDFHGKMTRYEMEGARGPSIAQLLDQNLLSPQQATGTGNFGEL